MAQRTEAERLWLLKTVLQLSSAQGVYIRETGTNIFVGANDYPEVACGGDPNWRQDVGVIRACLECGGWPLREALNHTDESIVTSGGPTWVTKTYPAGTRFKPFVSKWNHNSTFIGDNEVWETTEPMTQESRSSPCRCVNTGEIQRFELTEAIEPEAERRTRLTRMVILNSALRPEPIVIQQPEPHFRDTYSPRVRELVSNMLVTGGVSETVELYEEVRRRIERQTRERDDFDQLKHEEGVAYRMFEMDEERCARNKKPERPTGTPSWPSHDSGADWED